MDTWTTVREGDTIIFSDHFWKYYRLRNFTWEKLLGFFNTGIIESQHKKFKTKGWVKRHYKLEISAKYCKLLETIGDLDILRFDPEKEMTEILSKQLSDQINREILKQLRDKWKKP